MNPISAKETGANDAPQNSKYKKKLNKKLVISIGVGALILILAILALFNRYYLANNRDADQIAKDGKKSLMPFTKKSSGKKVSSPLNGAMVDEEAAKRHPLAVVIENHPEARPQSGLIKAAIVYEAITEGGITRFMGIYGPDGASELGPIRSARSFFIDWASEYNAYYAHAGGAADALDLLPKSPVFDLPHTNGYFERIPRGNAATEHTLYSSTDKLYQLAKAKKYPSNNLTENIKFKDDAKTENRGEQKTITVDFSTPSYKVVWNYDKEKNIYLRSLAGTAHKDRTSGEQLSAKTVIVMDVVRRDIQLPGAKATFKFTTTGQGKATIYQDGKVITGTWQKSNQQSRTKFIDSENNEVQLNRGVMWIEVVPPGTPITAS